MAISINRREKIPRRGGFRWKGCAPFHDFNEKILAECYRPNADLGNFEQMSFDLGPTLALWMQQHYPPF